MSIIRFFASDNQDIRITEFGYSAPQKERLVGPWVRDTYILHYVLCGTCRFSGFDVQAGEAFLIAKDMLHSFSVQPGYAHYWLAFDGNSVPQILSKHGIPLQSHTHFKVCHHTLAEELFRTAFEAADDDEGESAAQSALFAMLPLIKAQTANHSHRKDDRMKSVADFLETHYASTLTMEQVAKTVHLSEKHVCKCFKIQYGIPPQQYLTQVRMERAKVLLFTELSIGEIAKSVGYVSPLVFSAAFRKYTGVSPSNYRSAV